MEEPVEDQGTMVIFRLIFYVSREQDTLAVTLAIFLLSSFPFRITFLQFSSTFYRALILASRNFILINGEVIRLEKNSKNDLFVKIASDRTCRTCRSFPGWYISQGTRSAPGGSAGTRRRWNIYKIRNPCDGYDPVLDVGWKDRWRVRHVLQVQRHGSICAYIRLDLTRAANRSGRFSRGICKFPRVPGTVTDGPPFPSPAPLA